MEERFESVEELLGALEPLLRVSRDEWVQDTTDGPTVRFVRPAEGPTTVVEAFPGHAPERRASTRFPSSIPAGINGRGDLRHVALIHDTSRAGACLATRHAYEPGEVLILALQLHGEHHGREVVVEVVRVEPREGDPVWRHDVGVRFSPPLSDSLMHEIEKRAAAIAARAESGKG